MFKTYLSLGFVIALSFSSMSMGSNLRTAKSIQSETNIASTESQMRIDNIAETSLNRQAEIERLQAEVKSLEVYRSHLISLLQSQDEELQSLNGQINEIKDTRQGIVPLMYDMISGLNEIVENDAPIKLVQRAERIKKLEQMMGQANITDAEKFRRVLEAYQIEMDYGIKLSTFQGQLDNGEQLLEANMLHLGRMSLVARSLNETHYWAWSQNRRQWETLGSEQKASIDHAFSVANQQVAPSLLTLPISLKTVEEEK